MRHIAHYPGQHAHPMLAKTAVNFDFGDLTTIDPNTGRFRPVYSLDPSQQGGGNPKYRGYNILELLEDALANAVSFTPMVSYEEPTTVSVTCVESGWSASVDASKEGWGLRLLEQAEAHDDDYMGKWLDENSDFSGYRASRKTASIDTDYARSLGIDVDALMASQFVMSDYYSGQWSAGYAYVSTGTVTEGLGSEARDAARIAVENGDYEDAEALTALADYADAVDEAGPYTASRTSSRKTATGEMSEADLTPDGEWGFWVQVADAVGGTIHPFDKYQGPYIRYNGNKFWLVSDENGGELIYNETTDELRPSPMFFENTDVAYIAEQIRDMARNASRKTASHSLSFTADWKQDLDELNVIWQQAAEVLGVKAETDPRYPNSYTIRFNGYELDLITDASGWRIYNQQTQRSLQADIYDLWDDENPSEWMADRVRELTGVPANKPIDWIDEWEGGTNTPWSWNASRTSSRKTANSIQSGVAGVDEHVHDALVALDEAKWAAFQQRESDPRGELVYQQVLNAIEGVVDALNIGPWGRVSSRKTAEMSSSKHRYWRSKGYNIGAKVVANGYEPSDGDIEPLDGQFPGDSIPDVFGDDSDVDDLGGTLEEAIEAYEEGWWEAVEAARWDSDY